MGTYFILRKANGDILTVDVKGQPHIAVWDGATAVRRSKHANPDLIVYVPARLNRRLIERAFPNQSHPFFLVDKRDPDMRTGHEVGGDLLFSPADLPRAA